MHARPQNVGAAEGETRMRITSVNNSVATRGTDGALAHCISAPPVGAARFLWAAGERCLADDVNAVSREKACSVQFPLIITADGQANNSY